jgi:polysaccharide biosynthesis protein PelE
VSGSEIKFGYGAVLLEMAALTLLLLGSNDDTLLYRYFILHAMASAMMTPAAWVLLPAEYREPRRLVLALLFSLCFFIPVLGLGGFFLGVLMSHWWPYFRREQPYAGVSVPHYEMAKKSLEENRLRVGQVRSQLASTEAPLELRMKALMAIEHVSPRHASSVLRDALSDQADDLRLLAYGMLEGKEKKIAARIQQARDDLAVASEDTALYTANKQLAELYWELIYQGLVQGSMREYALEQVRHYSRAALRQQVRDSGLWVISGRMRLLTQDYQGALGAFSTAMVMGLPQSRAEPYLAELAFLQHRYDEVRERMQRIRAESRSQQMALLTDFWGRA